MSAAVSFNYTSWVARYPEFKSILQETAQEYFNEATLYWRNDGTSLASTTAIQSTLLNMMTAHIAALNSQSQGDPSPGKSKDANSQVGRVATATIGSVTVTTELAKAPGTGGTEAWLAQTRYGLAFWSATAAYRTSRYVPGQLQGGGLSPFGGVPWGGGFRFDR